MEEILTGKVENNSSFTVIMIDLERFKEINDLHGHKKGDEILQQFSKILLRVCKKDFHVTRVGGDEFLLISKNTLVKDVLEYKKQIQHEITESNSSLIRGIGVSFGAKEYNPSMDYTEDSIQDEVDVLMYQDKAKNKKLK